MERPIAYEPHPVSPERKAELVAQGYRIVDASFAPADAVVERPKAEPKIIPPAIDDHEDAEVFIDEPIDAIVAEMVDAPKPRRGRKKKAN